MDYKARNDRGLTRCLGRSDHSPETGPLGRQGEGKCPRYGEDAPVKCELTKEESLAETICRRLTAGGGPTRASGRP